MRVHEFLHTVNVDDPSGTLRVWAQADAEFSATVRAEQHRELGRVVHEATAGPRRYVIPSGEKLVEHVADLPWVNAVEWRGADGQGMLIYPDWP